MKNLLHSLRSIFMFVVCIYLPIRWPKLITPLCPLKPYRLHHIFHRSCLRVFCWLLARGCCLTMQMVCFSFFHTCHTPCRRSYWGYYNNQSSPKKKKLKGKTTLNTKRKLLWLRRILSPVVIHFCVQKRKIHRRSIEVNVPQSFLLLVVVDVQAMRKIYIYDS